MSLELLIIVCVAAIVATALTNRFRLIGPVMLIVAGLVASFAPGAEGAGLPSEVVLTVFLPVLLYWEALSRSTACAGRCGASSSRQPSWWPSPRRSS